MNKNRFKIAIVVHGRFDAFDLAQSLIKGGHNVTLFTNYPRWAARRFGIAPYNVRSFWLHGILSRLALLLKDKLKIPYPEAILHKIFGHWAASELIKQCWDIVHCWSGVSEELLKGLEGSKAIKILMRGSSHIRTQARLLEEEERRTNMPASRPDAWIIAREEREYDLADYIRVPSKFAYLSFIEEGIRPDKLLLIPSGVLVEAFRPSSKIAEERCKRIVSGKPLCILYVGALSIQKGIWDIATIIYKLQDKERFEFCLVGPVPQETKKFLIKFRHLTTIIPKQPQHRLPKWYAWADLFLFPTIQDGYAQVLAQAQASGLPIIATTNCGGPDIILEGETGWILPIRSPEAFVQRLLWCDSHRDKLAQMVKTTYEKFKSKDWQDIAQDFIKSCLCSQKKTI